MKRIIDIPEEVYNYIMRLNSCNMAEEYIKNSTPYETVTEFADRCRECGARYSKLLKQLQSGELISRQAVLNKILKFSVTDGSSVSVTGLWTEVNELPSVKPQEPKTGHWIVNPKSVYAHLVCDRCLSNAPYDCRTNYCPNCGAKMEAPWGEGEEA